MALLLAAAGHAYAANPVVINFDNLPTGVAITNQYQQYVTFSSTSNTVVTGYAYNSASWPNLLSRANGFGINRFADLSVNFTQPVNNLSFKVIGIHNYSPVAVIDYYVNGTLNRTINLTGCGYYCDVTVVPANLGINNITKVVIRNIVDPYGIDFDDFVFTPPEVEKVEITSSRVGGVLNNSTQNALLGADVPLQANIFPSNLSGGTYSWSVTGPNQQVSASNTNSSYIVRWTDTGTYQATVTYTRNQVSVSATVNVNVVVPTLDSFTANQEASGVSNLCASSSFGELSQYNLGCTDLGFAGIALSSTVHVPSVPYLSNPDQSGVKYVQRVSAFRKRNNGGLVQCRTRRASEGDNNSGWLFDGETVDTYDTRPTAIRRFSEGLSLTITTDDSPGAALEGPNIIPPPQVPAGLNDNHQFDAFMADDYFETFVVYFTSNSPSLQRTLGKLSWNWGGIVVYDARIGSRDRFPHRLTSMFGGTGQKTGVASNQSITYQGRVDDPSLRMEACPGVPTPTPPLNLIDNSRYFVQQQYRDILNRPPDGAWLVWVSFITECGFDQACINRLRIAVARGFFESAEFRQSHPGFDNPGSSQYNEIYVQQLYWTILRRPPDGAWTAWLNYINQTGNYDGLVGGFINSSEYRNRQWQ